MKKFSTIVCVLIIILTMPALSHALGVSIGASGWYSTWEMETESSNFEPDFDNTFLFGPLIAFRHNNWGLSSVYYYGKFNQNAQYGPSWIKRHDSDTTLSYSVNRTFRFFLGFKYMGYVFDGGEHIGYGPGAGLGLVVPLTQTVFLTGSLSGLYIWGSHDMDESVSGSSYDYKEVGVNVNIAIAFFIPSTSVTLSVGGRYQYFETIVTSENESSDDQGMGHTFYGLIVSAIYSFTI